MNRERRHWFITKRDFQAPDGKGGYKQTEDIRVCEAFPSPDPYDGDGFELALISPLIEEHGGYCAAEPEWYASMMAAAPDMKELLKEARRAVVDTRLKKRIGKLLASIDKGWDYDYVDGGDMNE